VVAVVAEWEMKGLTGEQVAMKAAAAEIPGPVAPRAMATKVAVHRAEWETKVQTGAQAAIKAATAVVIQMNKITWEEVAASPVVLKTKAEEEELTPARAGAVLPDHLQTDVAVAAAIGNFFSLKKEGLYN
jgi:hypothetical protein